MEKLDNLSGLTYKLALIERYWSCPIRLILGVSPVHPKFKEIKA
jgi:hypothetical protein